MAPRRLRLFVAGDAVSALGGALSLVALPLLALGALDASEAEVGLLRGAQTLPFLLLAVPVGLLADRLSRRRLMIGSDLARLVVVGAVPVAAALGVLSFPLLLGLALVAGAFTVVYEVTYLAVLPDLVDDRDELPGANRAVEVAHASAAVAGPGLAGALVGALSAATVVVVDAASFAVSALLLAVNRWRERPPAPRGTAMRRSLVAGWTYLRRSPYVGPMTAYLVVDNLAVPAFQTALLLLAVQTLQLPPALVGAVVAASAAGFVLGALASPDLGRRLGTGRLVCLASAIGGTGMGLVALAPGWAAVALAAAVAGLGPGLLNLQSISLRQAAVPAALLGRVTAVVKLVSYAALTTGAVLGGVAAAVAGPRAVVAAAALVSLAATAVPLLSPVRTLRGMPAEDDLGVPS